MQLKSAEGKGACPFCGNAEMHVSLIPVVGKRTASTSTPSKGQDRSGSVSSDADAPSSGRNSAASGTGTGPGPSALTYLTPEQDKRLRTYSQDATSSLNGSGGGAAPGAGTTPSSGGGAPVVARKADREALERQIREQRLHFDERDLAEAAARTANAGRRGGGPHYHPSSASGAGFGFGSHYHPSSASGAGFGSATQQYRQQQHQQHLRAVRYRLAGGGGGGGIEPAAAGVNESPTARYLLVL